MKLVKKMEELKVRFEESKNLFDETQEKLLEIQNEQRIMQGEYKALLELGMETGVLDSEGNPVIVEEVSPEEPTKE